MILKLEEIGKKYGNFSALADINLQFEPGITALLGPNGAGKSTMIKIITGALKKSTGYVYLDNKIVDTFSKSYLSNIGYVPQDFAFYDSFTIRQYLSYVGTLKGIKRDDLKSQVEASVELVNLSKDINKKINELSGGMKRRVMIAQSILSDPKLLILDEPTAGLDPEERIRIRNIISKMAGDRTVLIATHIVADIERIADQIVLIKKGRVVCKNTPVELMDSINGTVYEGVVDDSEYSNMQNDYIISQVRNAENEMHRVRFISNTEPDSKFVAVYPSLEEVYLKIMREQNDKK